MTYIYGDIIIVENFIMNFIIIYLTAYFSKKRTLIIKILLGSLVGAIYTILIYLPSMGFLSNISMKVSLSILIIVVVFTPSKIKDFIRTFSIFYLISFVFGGISFALLYMTNRGGLSSTGFFYVTDFSVSLLIFTCIIGVLIIKISWEYLQKKISKENIIVTIYIHIDGEKVKAVGLIDTANFLYDPISKLPVIVVEYDSIQSILPLEINEIFENKKENDFEEISKKLINNNWIKRFRMIPYSSLGNENGLLMGFKTDKITIFDEDEKKEIDNVIMAVYRYKLSNDEEYNVLLHPEILNT